MLADPRDRLRLRDGVRRLAALAAHAGGDAESRERITFGETALSDRAGGRRCRTRTLDALMLQEAGDIQHAAGTCRMTAHEDPRGVVDPDLKVRGVDGAAGRRCLHHADGLPRQPAFHLRDDRRGAGPPHAQDQRLNGPRPLSTSRLVMRPQGASNPRFVLPCTDDVAVGDVAVGDVAVGDVAVDDVAVDDVAVDDVAVDDPGAAIPRGLEGANGDKLEEVAPGGRRAAGVSLALVAQRGDGQMLARRLADLALLTDADLAALPGADVPQQSHELGAELKREGEPLTVPRLLTFGWACRMRMLKDGRRQILTLLVPGDCIGLAYGPLTATPAHWATVALTRLRMIDIEPLAAALRAGPEAHPGLARAFAAVAAIEHERLLERITSLGRRTATERVAHLMLELRDRLDAVGLMQAECFACPLTQEVMADLLGLSTVHVNRTLQLLRRQGLLAMRSGQVELLDPETLAVIADYEPPGIAAIRATSA